MQTKVSAKFIGYARPVIGALAVVLAFALLAFNVQPTVTAGAKDEEAVQTPQATFPANGGTLGAVADGPGAAGTCGTAKDITFTVAGMGAPLTNVEVSFTMTHTWVGDIEASLLAPGLAPAHLLFSRTGAATAASFGDSSDLLGPYNFKDSAAGIHWWTAAANEATGAAPVPAGDYRTVAAGPSAANPALTTMTTTFSGLGAGAVNGTWTLRMRDCGGGDTGTVSAATLTLISAPVVIPQHVADFDGDGLTDLSVFRPSDSSWYIVRSLSGTIQVQQFGLSTDRPVTADYDGDAKTDIAVFRNGDWYVLRSTNGTILANHLGAAGDIPTQADYDGDGKADISVFRPSTGVWYYERSSNGVLITQPFGANGDLPVPGDYTGDNTDDIAIWRPSNRTWYTSLDPATNYGAVQFGFDGDKPVQSDYDGDGKTDIAVFRPSSGAWYIIGSTSGFQALAFGLPGDVAIPGEYDGDGKSDVAIFRPSEGVWYIRPSTLNSRGLGVGETKYRRPWGQAGDKPGPFAYVPEQ